MNRQRLLDHPPHGNEYGTEDGCDEEQKGNKANEQNGSKVGQDRFHQWALLIRKSPNDVKSLLGLNKKAASTYDK